jgi:DHA2 family multidrug resistance protein
MNVSRNLGGTFGISLVQTMLAQRLQVHQSQYVETLNPLHPTYTATIDHMARILPQHGLSQATAGKAAVAEFYQQLVQQMSMLSYIDVFHTLMVLVFAALPLVLLMRSSDKKARPGAA